MHDVPHFLTSVGKNHGSVYRRHDGQIEISRRSFNSLARSISIDEVALFVIESR